MVIGKMCPRNATDPEDVEVASGGSPKGLEPPKRPNGTPKTRNVTRVGNRKMARSVFERQEIEATQETLLNAL